MNLAHSPIIAEQEIFNREQFIAGFKDKAEENAYQKFGDKIEPVISTEFKSVILPKIEEAIEEMACTVSRRPITKFND